MEVTVQQAAPTYQLTLTEEEAVWLAAMMQNPLIKEFAPAVEDDQTAIRRALLFTALDQAYRSQSRK